MKPIGNTGLFTGPIGLGCVTFGREIDEAASFRLLDYAVERGVTLLDTAESYGGGQAGQSCAADMHSSEKIIGRWLRANACRKQIILQTKVSSGYTGESIRRAIDNSLQRLQTDHIDLYLLHKLDSTMPLQECLEALGEAIRANKIAAAGCSNVSAECLRSSIEISEKTGLPRFQTVQPPYSLVERSIEADLLPLCADRGIAVISYSPLAAGFLSGKYSANRADAPAGSRFHRVPGHCDLYFSDHNFQVVQRLHSFAARVGVPPLRLALSWALQNTSITAVLAGARSMDQIQNTLAARDLEMPEEWRAELASFSLAAG